jgi:hypothetical protein
VSRFAELHGITHLLDHLKGMDEKSKYAPHARDTEREKERMCVCVCVCVCVNESKSER